MKSLLIKTAISLIVFISCSNANAMITRYENTNTNSLVYGSYDFDDVLNKFSNFSLKANFSKLNGPSEIQLDFDQSTISDTEVTASVYWRGGYVDGTRPDTHFEFDISSFISSVFPNMITVSSFGRWEIVNDGGVIDYVNGLNAPDFFAESIYFSAIPDSVANVPEPEVISLLGISPLILLVRRRKQQK